ncbi:MAG: protein phosphatase 2C domain-containing protein [Mogibacterium sp.]|nr:protein phosphatase 2C domain-containing protein [Mogibacterium sp.]
MGNNKRTEESSDFRKWFDTIIQLDKPAREGLGEDSFYCVRTSRSALVSVCDGCGGLGARTYPGMSGHTGAYMASRLVSGAVRDWYHDNCKSSWTNVSQLSGSINAYISSAYAVCDPYAKENQRIRGSLMRRLPTTLALAYVESAEGKLVVNLVWAGDSRVYLLDSTGLSQLTQDDTAVKDALENLVNDSPMNNVIAADGNYRLNTASIHLQKPALIIACTDGCFSYMQSPMDFEYSLLKTLVGSETPEKFKAGLAECFDEYAGDDYAFSLMSLGFGTYNATRKAFAQRCQHMKEKYVVNESADDYHSKVRESWQEYKINYEKYLNRETV